MADSYPDMLDLAKKTGADSVVGLIEENLERYPEARLFAARTIVGTSFKTLLRVDYPDPSFRAVNDVTSTKKSSFENKLVEAYFLDGQLEVDEALDGADDNNIASEMVIQAEGMVKGAMRKIGKQVWGGTALDAKGFPGAVSIVPSGLTVDATGTTATTGSSCYLVIMGPQNAQLIFGKGQVLTIKDWFKQRVDRTVGGTAGHLMAYLNNISGWVGIQWVNPYCVGRIKNLTADSGKGLTDSLISDLIATFPADVDMGSAYLFMTRRSARQLQKSRTATSNTTGNAASTPTPEWPTSSNGIPIVQTSSLTDVEAIA